MRKNCASGSQTAGNSPGSTAPPAAPARYAAGIQLAPFPGMDTSTIVPVRQFPVVRAYMTESPHTIARSRSLTAATRTMRDHQVRHLPVLEGGRIAGILSQRDVLLIE